MIIDAILDRKDGVPYNEYETLKYIYDNAMLFEFDYLSAALDYGTDADIKKALEKYIVDNNYNPKIIEYVYSVTWLS